MHPEIALLSALMQAGDKKQNILDDVSELVQPADFEHDGRREIYTAILNLRKRQSNYTCIELVGYMGTDYTSILVSIETQSIPWTNAMHYAKTIAEVSARRKVEMLPMLISELASNREFTAEQLYDEVQTLISKVEPKTLADTGLVPVVDLLPNYFDELEALAKEPGEIKGVKTNKKDLDRILHGFKNKDLIILAARPSVGKTAFSLDMMLEIIKEQVTVCFFSVEMSKDKAMLDRIMANCSNVESERLATGHIGDEEWSKLTMGTTAINRHFLIDDTPDMSLQHIKRQARLTRRKVGDNAPMIIFVDYLQIIKKPNGMSEYEATSYFSRELKMLAKEVNAPVVALSQLNRGTENRADKRPTKGDLRGSGQIEQDADVIIFLHRDDYTDPNAERKNIVDVIVDKHRNGRTGQVEMVFMKDRGRFLNLDKELR